MEPRECTLYRQHRSYIEEDGHPFFREFNIHENLAAISSRKQSIT